MRDNDSMSIDVEKIGVSPEIRAESQAVVEHLQTGKPMDQVMSRRITERAETIRHQIRKEEGVQNLVVEIIRELRGPLDEESVNW